MQPNRLVLAVFGYVGHKRVILRASHQREDVSYRVEVKHYAGSSLELTRAYSFTAS